MPINPFLMGGYRFLIIIIKSIAPRIKDTQDGPMIVRMDVLTQTEFYRARVRLPNPLVLRSSIVSRPQ